MTRNTQKEINKLPDITAFYLLEEHIRTCT